MIATRQFLLVSAACMVLGFSGFHQANGQTATQKTQDKAIDEGQKATGIVRQPDGKPAKGVLVKVITDFSSRKEVTTDAEGKFELTWQPNNSDSGGPRMIPCILARDPEHNLAVAEEFEEDDQALTFDLKLAPGLTLAGRAECNGKPVANAAGTLIFWSGNCGLWLDGVSCGTNVPGHFEIPALPTGRRYGVYVSAPGFGRKEINNVDTSEAGRKELDTVELKVANLKLSGQVVDADEKPVANCLVYISGNEQPHVSTNTDSQGRFTFVNICESGVRVYANGNGSSGSVSADGGDTNVVVQLGKNSSSGNREKPVLRASLNGKALPDLASVNLPAESVPANGAVLVCLFDAGQRPSRYAVRQLNEKAAALKQQGISLVAVQASFTSDEIFNSWKSASTVAFPVGRVTDKSDQSKWASSAPSLPMLILTDAKRLVIAEGFALDELDEQVKKVGK